jgi:predicted nucleic acid-binding protein
MTREQALAMRGAHAMGEVPADTGPRASPLDCMIAAVAYRLDLTLLAWDADMFHVTEVIGIRLDEASLRAG